MVNLFEGTANSRPFCVLKNRDYILIANSNAGYYFICINIYHYGFTMRNFSFLICFLVLFFNIIDAQNLSIGVEGGALMTVHPSEFSKNQPDGLGMKYGVNSGLKIDYQLSAIPIKLTGNASYSYFKRNGEYRAPIYIYDDGALVGAFIEQLNSEAATSIYSIGAGADWTVADWKVSPYLTGGLFLNYFETKSATKIELLDINDIRKDQGTRLGAFIGAGTELNLFKNLDLDISVKYNFYDLLDSRGDTEDIEKINNNFSAIYLGTALMWNVF